MSTTSSPDLLETIVAAARRIVEVRAGGLPQAVLEQQVFRVPDGAAFETALRHGQAPRVIAECKRRSPSRGILRAEYDPARHARAYEAAGAAAISVLTEPTFFDGAPDHLRAVRDAVGVPVLRKDFIVTEYQLVEAAALGADAVLLIVAALDDRALRRLLARAAALGLACLTEVHEADETRRALDAGARVIGVNSRNLRTLAVEPRVLEAIVPLLPSQGSRRWPRAASARMRTSCGWERLGYHAFLVGEQLIRQPDPGAALRTLRQTTTRGVRS
jgi:indole-3-glycerol phosphate synthase